MKNKIVTTKEITAKDMMWLSRKASWVRNKVLEMAIKGGAGHIAPAFSCVEILITLYYLNILRVNPKNPKWKDRDRFILSKGQAALALYPILADLGFFSLAELMTFIQDGSRLGGLAENNVPGVEALTGSLGHGLSIATGIALSAKIDSKKYLCFTLLGDGECHEGSVWEAAMFAGQHHLNNLIAIVDNNRLSATDFLRNYLDLAPLKEKWESFGWEVKTVIGHSFKDLLGALSKTRLHNSDKPLAILALTTKGKGVSFMEDNPIWHYRIPIKEELREARRQLVLER